MLEERTHGAPATAVKRVHLDPLTAFVGGVASGVWAAVDGAVAPVGDPTRGRRAAGGAAALTGAPRAAGGRSTAKRARGGAVRIDSMSKYCLLARGDAHVYMRVPAAPPGTPAPSAAAVAAAWLATAGASSAGGFSHGSPRPRSSMGRIA